MMSGYHDGFSSDPDEDSDKVAGTTFARGRPDLHRKITKIKEMVFSDEEGDCVMSPIGSPREGFNMGGRGKFLELKKKLEDDQAKRSKLAASTTEESLPDGIHALDVTSILEGLRTTNELRDQSRASYVSMRWDNHPKFTELKKRIKERDHKILDYESRLNEMDRQAVDLQDTLNQREKLLTSKNEAVNVVHNKYRKELEQKDEELRKTQQTMFNLEKNLSGIQDQFNAEKERLNQEVKSYQQKTEMLRDSTNAHEVKTEALEAKTVVLEEEILRLREEKHQLSLVVTEKEVGITEKENLISNKDIRIQELVALNEKSDLTLKKLKTQFQTKLRAMKEKQTEMEETVKSVERVKVLENQIAELEEEKGNFLLQKMENEEVEAFKSIEIGKKIADLQTQIQNERNTTEKLEKELATRAAQQEDIISEHRIELGLLQNELANYKESTESSLAAYHKTINELEEQLLSTGNVEELQSLISILKVELAKANEANEISEVKQTSSEAILKETLNRLETLEWDHHNALESCNALSCEISRLTSSNEATLNEVNDKFKISLEQTESELQKTQETVVELRKNLEALEEERPFEIIRGEASNVEIVASQATFANLENQVILECTDARHHSALNDELSELKTENEFLQVKIKDQESKLSAYTIEFENLKWDHQTLVNSCRDLSTEIKHLREFRYNDLEATQNERQTEIASLGEMQENANSQPRVMHKNDNLLEEIERQKDRINYLEQIDRVNMETIAQLEKNYQERIIESEILADELEETKLRIFDLKTSLEILSHENNSLMDKVVFLKSEKIESLDTTKILLHSDDISLLRQQNEKLLLDVTEKGSKIEELVASCGKLELTLKRLKVQFQTKLKALKEKHPDIEEAVKSSERIKELENRIAELEDEKGNFLLQKMENEEEEGSNNAIQLEAQLQSERKRIEEYEKNIVICKNERDDLISEHRIEVGLLQNELANYKESMESSLVSYQTTIVELQEQLSSTENIEELQSLISVLKNEIVCVREEKESLQDKLNSDQNKFVKTENEFESLKWDHQNLLESCNALSAEISRLNSINEETILQAHTQHKQSLEEKEAALQTGQEKSLQLEAKLVETGNQLETLKWDHQSLLENCETLSTEITNLNLTKEESIEKLHVEYKQELEVKMADLQLATQKASVDLQVKLTEALNELETLKLDHQQILTNSIALSAEIGWKDSANEEVLNELQREYEKSIEQKTTELQSFQKMSAELKFKLTENEKEFETMKSDHQSVLKNCETLSSELIHLNATVEDALTRVHSEHKELLELKTVELEAVQEKLIQVQSKLIETTNELETSKWDHQNVLEKCGSLSSELSHLNSTLEDGQTRVHAEHKESFELKTVELETVQEKLIQLQSKLAETTNELETSKWVHQNVLENCGTLSAEICRLNTINEEALTAVHTEYKKHLEMKTAELEEVQNNVVQLQSKLIEAENEVESLNWDHQSVLENCEALSKEVSRLNSIHAETLIEAHSQYQKNSEEKQLELERAQESLTKLQRSLDLETARLQELQKETSTAESSLSLQSVIAELENQLSLARVDLNNLSALQDELREIKDEREVLQTQIQDLETNLELSATELERLKWDHQSLSESCDDLSTEIRNIHESKKQELDIANKEHQAKVEKIIKDCQAKLDSQQTNTNRLDALVEEIEKQKHKIEYLEQTDRLQKDAISGLEQSDQAKTIEAERLEDELEETKYQMSDITTNLEIISHENSRLMGEVSFLKSESATLRAQLSQRALELESYSKQSSPSPSDSLITGASDAGYQSAQTDEDKQKLTAEIKELRIRNGKLTLRFKQVKEKYDELVKENERLKNSKFGLDSALEDVLQEQVKEKDERLNENEKILGELLGEKERLGQKVDLLERANDKLVEIKESQETYVKQLHQEISALKWRIEELENLSTTGGDSNEFAPPSFSGNSQTYENHVLKEQIVSLEDEIRILQSEKLSLSSTVAEINAMNLSNARVQDEILRTTTAINLGSEVVKSGDGSDDAAITVDSYNVTLLQQTLEDEHREKKILERKIELLQGKILEIEESEMRCFEESLMLKSWTRELEVDNQKYQLELEQIYNSVTDGDVNNVKVKTLQNEIIRLVDALQDRDRRCEELTAEITRLLEERDGLQLKLSNVLQHNTSLHVEANEGELPDGEIASFDREVLEQKLGELEQINYVINMDLRREREARRLVQEQLFFSQSSRGYKSQHPRGNRSPVSPPSPPMRSPSRISIPGSLSSPALLPVPSMLPSHMQIPPTVLQPSSRPIPFPSDQFHTVDLNSEMIPPGANQQVPKPPPSPVLLI